MNIVRLRHSKLFRSLVLGTNFIAKFLPLKLGVELLYWKLRKLSEGILTNTHYEAFFTVHFGLTFKEYEGRNILDIGCGPRGSLEWIADRAVCYGLDPLADSYLKMGASKQRMNYIKGTSEDIPFESSYFDIVSSFNSLDHVDDLHLSINEIKRVLKPGGYFLLIADIHPVPTVTEPSNFSWDVTAQFLDDCILIKEAHYEGHHLYQSIRKAIPYNHDDPSERYGVLTALFQKK